ncbi:DgyrCDS2159 [Dimorphilus gyrociliatus]|uniref:DgyrCDS2159 n=1 Tax=Dimorphilus gyrociliatus TaxID=2664684 RepID=A0A7I8VBD9_9ANNE|nr:DgyrCDS2159 [Dimorphilus gyrociliatus]
MFQIILLIYISGVSALEKLYTIPENSQPIKLVNLNELIEPFRRFSEDELKSVKFSILNSKDGARYKNMFEVKGRELWSSDIDRESIEDCVNQEFCYLKFDLKGSDGKTADIASIRIQILDENDNIPKFNGFRSENYDLSISEGQPVSEALNLPYYAVDKDSPENGIDYYTLSGSDKFELVNGKLQLLSKLDREREAIHHIVVKAIDKGTPSLTGTLLIRVLVTDYNDNAPKFEKETYEVSVYEDEVPGSVIQLIKATDKDEGKNAIVSYSIDLSQSDEEVDETFRINNKTGELILTSLLDYDESKRNYRIMVTAQDNGADSLKSQALVNVKILNVNDNKHKISVIKEFRIVEEQDEDTEAGEIYVHDKDINDGSFNCLINDTINFHLVPYSISGYYRLLSAKVFDREEKSEFPINLTCFDSENLPESLITIVKVLDFNDHAPKFNQTFYEFTIKENDPNPLGLYSVFATDADEGSNAIISYSVSGTDLVYVHSTTGQLFLKSSLDFEQIQTLEFKIEARDHGSIPMASQVPVSIQITDLNDERPVFVKDVFEMHVLEESSPTEYVGKVLAVDRDQREEFRRHTYELLGSTDLFTIDEVGRIYTKRTFDREIQDLYEFKVKATGVKDPSSTSTALVSISIEDINDHKPIIDFPNPSNSTITVKSNLGKDRIFGRILARDSDIGVNGALVYEIIAGNEDDMFYVHGTTGTIAVNDDLRGIRQLKYLLKVRVTDSGSERKFATSNLTIIVLRSIGDGSSAGGDPSFNLMIVVALSSVTLLIVVVLLFAIFLVRRRQRLLEEQAAKDRKENVLELEKVEIHARVEDGKIKADTQFRPLSSFYQVADHNPPRPIRPQADSEVKRLMELLRSERDCESLSNSDSGKGSSEHGDNDRPPTKGRTFNDLTKDRFLSTATAKIRRSFDSDDGSTTTSGSYVMDCSFRESFRDSTV